MNKALLTALLLLAGLFTPHVKADVTHYIGGICDNVTAHCEYYSQQERDFMNSFHPNLQNLIDTLASFGYRESHEPEGIYPYTSWSHTLVETEPHERYSVDYSYTWGTLTFPVIGVTCADNEVPDVVTFECKLADGAHCPAGQKYDSVTQSCVSECRDGFEWDSQLQTCLCAGPTCVTCQERASCLVVAHDNCFDQGKTLETFSFISEGNFVFTCIDGDPNWEPIEAAIANIDTNVDNLTGAVSSVGSDVTGISTSVSSLDAKVDALGTKIDGLELGNNEELNAKLDSLTANLASTDSGLHGHISSVQDQLSSATGGLHDQMGDIQSQIGNSEGGIHQHISQVEGQIGDLSSQIHDLLDGAYTGALPEDFGAQRDAILDDVTGQLNDTFNMTETELGGQPIAESDDDFIETFIGNIEVSACQNPVFLGDKTLDICSRASTINETLYFIFAALTLIAIWHELHKVARRNT